MDGIALFEQWKVDSTLSKNADQAMADALLGLLTTMAKVPNMLMLWREFACANASKLEPGNEVEFCQYVVDIEARLRDHVEVKTSAHPPGSGPAARTRTASPKRSARAVVVQEIHHHQHTTFFGNAYGPVTTVGTLGSSPQGQNAVNSASATLRSAQDETAWQRSWVAFGGSVAISTVLCWIGTSMKILVGATGRFISAEALRAHATFVMANQRRTAAGLVADWNLEEIHEGEDESDMILIVPDGRLNRYYRRSAEAAADYIEADPVLARSLFLGSTAVVAALLFSTVAAYADGRNTVVNRLSDLLFRASVLGVTIAWIYYILASYPQVAGATIVMYLPQILGGIGSIAALVLTRVAENALVRR